MSFFNELLKQMDRSTAGSDATARTVLEMCGRLNAKTALFFGDDLFTPTLIAKKTGANLLATFYEDYRAQKAAALGFNTRVVGAYEVTRCDDANGWDFIWFNGSTEPDGVPRRLEQMRDALGAGGVAVYRSLCWLIDPSLDTKSYVDRRFGRPVPLDAVLLAAKEHGLKVSDFYISPKSDWVHNFYEPMRELLGKLERESDGEDSIGIGEVNKETYMFELHSEEYSYVYFILGRK